MIIGFGDREATSDLGFGNIFFCLKFSEKAVSK